MSDTSSRSVRMEADNPALADLELSWQTSVFSDHSGIAPMGSLHEAGDALAAVAFFGEDGLTIMGSAVMVGPGLLLTATHVLEEIAAHRASPVFLTFLAEGARAWLPRDVSTLSRPSRFEGRKDVASDLSLVSCTLNSDALAEHPLMLAPMQIALPLVGDRLWAMGFRHQGIDDGAAMVEPLVSSGLVVAAYPNGRGERMISPCFEVDMATIGGMSGGAVVNADGFLVGIVSSSWTDGAPSYMTLIWDAVRLRVRGQIPKLQRDERVSILGAKTWGLAKLKGHVERDPFGEVHLTFSEDEMKLMLVSMSLDERSELPRPALTADEREEFVDRWSSDLEDAALDGALRALGRLSLEKARDLLEDSDVPADCLETVTGFSVEDFDGVEDISVTSTEKLDGSSFLVNYYFDIRTLIWTVQMDATFAEGNADRLDELFVNREVIGELATMEIAQRRYFRGFAVFHRDSGVFSDATISLSAIKPARRRRQQP